MSTEFPSNDFDSFESETELLGETNFLDQEGIYALKITEVHRGRTVGGKSNSNCLTIDTVVVGANEELAATVGKSVKIQFIKGKANDKDGGKMGRRKLTALGVACNLITPEEVVDGKTTKFVPQNMVGQIVVAKLVKGQEYEGKRMLQLSYADIYHVDDRKAQGPHLSEQIKNGIGPGNRKDPKLFLMIYKDTHSGGPQRNQGPTPADELFADL